MLKRIKKLLKGNLFIIALIISITIVFLSLLKLPSSKINIINIDKAYHSIAYFALGITWLFAYYKKPEKKYFIVICCIIFGIIIEVLQSKLTSYRTGDYVDAIANSCGVLLALLIFNLFVKKK
tara:strand:- start:59 stop:427 length:369 start_codon:yes stop_codon:yes gene_type:complete